MRKAALFLETLAKVSAHAIKTGRVLDKSKVEPRLEVCTTRGSNGTACEHYNGCQLTCMKCGCYFLGGYIKVGGVPVVYRPGMAELDLPKCRIGAWTS